MKKEKSIKKTNSNKSSSSKETFQDSLKESSPKKKDLTKPTKNKSINKVYDTEKITKICLISFIIIEIILILLGLISKKIAYYIWLFLIIPIKSLRYFISQFLSFKIGSISLPLFSTIMICALILIISYYIITNSKKISDKRKEKYTNIIKIAELVVIMIEFGIYLGVELMSYNNPNINSLYFKEQANNKYTKDDIIEYATKLEGKIIELSHELERDKEGNIIVESNLSKLAKEDLKSVSSKYKILSGVYPNRFFKITEKELKKNSTTNGITSFDMVNINYNQPSPQLLNTMTHELCHTRGISREYEAVLCSVMVGLESKNKLSNYAAYLESYERALDALNIISPSFVTESEDRLSTLCIENNYKEICDFYNIETDYYVEESNEIEIGTYNTSYYDIKYLKELINELEPFNPTYYLDGVIISNEKITEHLDKDKHLSITIKNDEKTFNEIKIILDKYKDKLQYVSQTSPNDYTPPSFTEEEAEEYYTSEVPEGNVTTQLTDDAIQIYDYSRATRLIMEYFDHENL